MAEETPKNETAAPAPEPVPYAELLKTKLAEPELIDTICAHVANGGTPIDLCRAWNIRYSDLIFWLYNANDAKSSGRYEKFQAALKARDEWEVEALLSELRHLSYYDIRKIYDKDGNILPPSQWPDSVAKAVTGLEVFEEYTAKGDYLGRTKKVKLSDRKAAIELLGKKLAMFVNLHKVAVGKTLEELVSESNQKEPAASPTIAQVSDKLLNL